jgi:peptidoglycan hydrolase-like protein with peptidoglycan-binding domain
MSAGDLKILTLAFAVMTATVAVNILALQEKRAGSGIETSALRTRALGPSASNRSASDVGATPVPVDRLQPGSADVTAEITRGIQRELNGRGYDAGQPDGVAGLVTQAAIMAYEYDYGLPLTATPSQDVLSRIVLGSSAPPTARGAATKVAADDAESVIAAVKAQLASRGYTTGKADGALNEQLARAIREFEVDQKLPESGRISGPLVSRLLRLQGQLAQPGQSPQVLQAAPPAAAASKPGKVAATKPPAAKVLAAKPLPAKTKAAQR